MVYYCILKEPGTSISRRLSRELWSDLNQKVEDETFANLSVAIREFLKLGLWLYNKKENFQDDGKVQEIMAEYNSKINEKAILDWPKELTDSQIDGVVMSFTMEKERRNTSV